MLQKLMRKNLRDVSRHFSSPLREESDLVTSLAGFGVAILKFEFLNEGSVCGKSM
ncbi:hypothetical protein E2C01_045160 [Portunus trituberculatus]|uniref:Uncharacterized protein n=1 Tax=Portunus trituberculatus TaxID=210409 RepID=A0A5B7G181_PORTR|nr:hypothetical protein [Portunus trituberculatus]